MFTAVSFINKNQKQFKCQSTGGWIHKMWYICTKEYYSAKKETTDKCYIMKEPCKIINIYIGFALRF